MQEVIEAIVTGVIGVLAAAVAGFFGYITPKTSIWFKEKTRDNKLLSEMKELGVMERVSDMAVEIIEKEFTGESGEKKFDEAASYVAMMANRYGINVSDEFIKGAVQKAWRDMDEKQKNKQGKE